MRRVLSASAALAALLAAAAGCTHAGSRADAPPTSVTLPRPDDASPDNPPSSAIVPGAAYRGERERCVDRELARQNLNAYGDPLGTTYPTGSPLVDLTTGVSIDRLRYVVRRHPDIGAACSREPNVPER